MKIIDLIENKIPVYMLRLKNTWIDEGDPDDYEPDIENKEYDIILDGNVVGELTVSDPPGLVGGHLHNKILPYNLNITTNNMTKSFNSWLNNPSGQRWYSNIDKYKPLKSPRNDYRLRTNKR